MHPAAIAHIHSTLNIIESCIAGIRAAVSAEENGIAGPGMARKREEFAKAGNEPTFLSQEDEQRLGECMEKAMGEFLTGEENGASDQVPTVKTALSEPAMVQRQS